jgi:hypothetical protein
MERWLKCYKGLAPFGELPSTIIIRQLALIALLVAQGLWSTVAVLPRMWFSRGTDLQRLHDHIVHIVPTAAGGRAKESSAAGAESAVERHGDVVAPVGFDLWMLVSLADALCEWSDDIVAMAPEGQSDERRHFPHGYVAWLRSQDWSTDLSVFSAVRLEGQWPRSCGIQ